MRKYILTATLVFSCLALAQAQAPGVGTVREEHRFKLGVKVGPVLSTIKTRSTGNTSFQQNGNSLEFLLGAFVDMRFRSNYYFHFGLNILGRTTDVTATDPAAGTVQESYEHEYLQAPFLVKLYTDEFFLDTNFFMNFGVVPQIRLSSRNDGPGNSLITKFYAVDVSGNIGGGAERAIGVNTRIFLGLNYNLGLVNMIARQDPDFDGLILKSRLFALEVGLKF